MDQRFDLIVGSDILYERQAIAPLDRFFRKHLAADGWVVLSDPSRRLTDAYLQQLADSGWRQTMSLIYSNETRCPTRIVEMTR
jgi:predicted nicotinamide N-methyase